MCRKIYITNELVLGQRPLGWEAWVLPKGEVQEFTSKQLKDIMKQGNEEVYGLVMNKVTGDLEADKEGFYVTNYMVKSHINSLVPKNPEDCLANLFYIVIGSHKEKNNLLYDVISSRYERTSFNEDKVKTLLEMGIISAGVKLVGDKLEIAITPNQIVNTPQKEKEKSVESK